MIKTWPSQTSTSFRQTKPKTHTGAGLDGIQTYMFLDDGKAPQILEAPPQLSRPGKAPTTPGAQHRFSGFTGRASSGREEFSQMSLWNRSPVTDNPRLETLLQETNDHLQTIQRILERLEVLLQQHGARQASVHQRICSTD